MKFIRTAILALIAIVLIVLAVANRDIVTLRLTPFETTWLFGVDAQIDLPLFVVILFGILLGLLIGLLWEYLREAKYRRQVVEQAKALKKADRELKQVKKAADPERDDVLDLLEEN